MLFCSACPLMLVSGTLSLLRTLWDFFSAPYTFIVYTGCHENKKKLHPVFSAHSYQTDCLLRSTASPQINTYRSGAATRRSASLWLYLTVAKRRQIKGQPADSLPNVEHRHQIYCGSRYISDTFLVSCRAGIGTRFQAPPPQTPHLSSGGLS